ncbi:MAG: signal peptidase II [Sodalis sp. (in: enterobacteria)]
MNNIIRSTGLRWLWLTLIVFLLDLGSKHWILKKFFLGESIPIIPFINFIYVINPGAAFSFLADREGWQRWMFSTIALLISMVLLVIMYRSKNRSISNVAYAMIIGGALGNLWDRIIYGVVIDFIDFNIKDYHWPAFNLADVGICIGAILIILEGFYFSKRKNC